MAGTDRGKRARGADGIAPGPAMILVEPQLGENIGMVARAMLNCGLGDLRLVVPRDGWPNESAVNAASGADVILDRARVFGTTEEAIRDCSLVFAATARTRDMAKDQLTAKRAARELKALFNDGGRAGVLFGKESKGLNNNDVALADAIVQVPLNPGFTSLNLAQAVLLVGYEWFRASDETEDVIWATRRETRAANKDELVHLFGHLESSLIESGFLWPPEKRPTMIRNIRNMLQRARLTEREVRSFRGMIKSMMEYKPIRKP